ncbi:MAG: methyltransferase domain-containing protein [Nanoarchaeota archaeon]|nr:methyltransferase domain-containing protein [Nanoarchaeota archaeon]
MVKQILIKALEIVKGGKALDLGAEKGLEALYLICKGFNVTAIDISAENCKEIEAMGIPTIRVINQDINDFKFDDKYELINCGFVLHFIKEKAREFIKKMQENTKENGVNVLAAFLNKGGFEIMHSGFLEQNELKKLYEGWDIVDYYETFVPTRERNPDGTVKKQMAAFAVFRKT